FTDGSPPMRALLDSGAVRNYIAQDEVLPRSWKVESVATVARLANNTKVGLRGRVQLPVRVGSSTAEVPFYILPRVEDGSPSPSCILGVRSMCDLGISLQFSAGNRQVIVKQLTPGPGCSPMPNGVPDPSTLVRPEDSPVTENHLSGQADERVQVLCETLTIVSSKDGDEEALYCVSSPDLDGLTESGEAEVEVESEATDEQKPLGSTWRSVRAAPDYSVRLRRLADGEVRDCAGQTHAVEATWAVKDQSRPDQPSAKPKP
ncbi:hypothetical protein FOL47_004416, partial [Perkinsus chesapeaki]